MNIRTRMIRLAIAGIIGGLGSFCSAVRADDLSTLGDDKTMSAMSDLGLDTLLDRMFELKHTPESQRTGLRALRSLHQLADPNVKLGNSQRQRLVKSAVDGIAAILPTISDPDALLAYAGSLLQYGVTPDVNLLEYWGDNPVTEARLHPVVKTVIDLLDRAGQLSTAQAADLGNKLSGADDPRSNTWEHLDNLSHTCDYKKNMVAYFLELATDPSAPSGQAERVKIAQDALKYLTDLDNADSGVMPGVHLMMAKLRLAMGSYSEARTGFDSIANDSNKQIVPPPDVYQRYEARYFTLVAQLENKNIDGARSGLEDLIKWQKSTLPSDKPTQDGVAAAAEMMRYRIFSAQAAQAENPEARRDADDKAVAVLEQLKKDRPELAPIIYEQLMNRIPADKPVATLDPLILQGLMNKGIVEANKPDSDKPNMQVIGRAIEAAHEVVSRKDRTGIGAELTNDAQLLIPKLYDREGKALDAAEGYLDYAEKNGAGNPQGAKDAMDRTGYLIFSARKQSPDDVRLGAIYDRFLPAAIKSPFNHHELAFLYAKRLRLLNQPAEAVQYFRMVPKDDSNYLSAQYFLMLTLKDVLDTKLSEVTRGKTLAELQSVCDNVKQLGSASTEPKDRFKGAHATLIAAEMSVEEPKTKDPKRALQLLDGFEAQVKGIPGEKDLLAEALFVRVNAYMDVGQLDQATSALVGLLDKAPDSAPGLVRQMLEKLDGQYARADIAHDAREMRAVATNEAKLTGFLADWATKSQDPKIHQFAYQYRVYDANTKRKAGTLDEDPKLRQAHLEAAKALYTELLSPANHDLYLKTLDPAKLADGTIDPTMQDVAVRVGLAFTEYELKDYVSAQAILGDLVGNRLLGSPTVQVEEAGEQTLKDNDLYWEGTLRLLECNVGIARQGGPDSKQIMAGTQEGLKQDLIRGGIPARWADDFEKVRADILPDWKPPLNVASATQPSAALSAK
jgi:hypothetical protein